MPEPMTPLAWATDTFGPIARNRDERAIRLAEEAIELAQAEGVSRDAMHKLVDRIFGAERGHPFKEVHGVCMTLQSYIEVAFEGFTFDEMVSLELRRCKLRSKEEWQRRHEKKAEQGIADLSPVDAT